ncbi:MAG: glycosyltransferase family 4 protein, partial [Pseudomonadota bacterium]|nr:glycosyltransferase family 4 protein [Pseudomonadota bacterium]
TTWHWSYLKPLQKMKILHINTEKTWRGGEQQLLYLICGLKKRNITSHLVCQPASPLEEKARAEKIETFPVAMRSEIDLRAAYKIRKLINRYHYDIIHSHTSHAHTIAFFAALGSKTRLLVSRRVDLSIFRHSFLRLSSIKYRLMADHYIAISKKIKDVMVADGIPGQHISVAHSGIDLERFATTPPDHLIQEFNLSKDDPIIVNIAHLAWVKGQTHLIKAIPQVLVRVPNARFFIVGGGELLAELQALASSLDIDRNLTFTGFRDDVGAFYQLADIVVMSSIQEGLGTAVIDALALAKPVVASNAGGIPEIIENGVTGTLVPPADPQALAEGIIAYLANPERARQIGLQGQQKVRKNFSVDHMVEKNIDVYRQLLMDS